MTPEKYLTMRLPLFRYVRLGEVVDHVFPLKMRSSSSDFPCSDTYSHFTYWRQQLPRVEPQGTTPPQSPLPSS